MSAPLLEILDLNKSYGALRVTSEVTLRIPPAERHVIIGPNGAGKTSLLHQIGGQVSPTSGRILFKGRDIAGQPPEAICRAGIGRTFQKNNLFLNLSVLENVALAVTARRGTPFSPFPLAARRAKLVARAREILADLGLGASESRIVRQLSYGEQRQLEIALALATDPDLLLLDEPTSGMSPAETAGMIALISALPRALTILMIEHDMEVVFSIADRITVLHYGKVLASGEPSEISDNPQVRAVYLGALAAEAG